MARFSIFCFLLFLAPLHPVFAQLGKKVAPSAKNGSTFIRFEANAEQRFGFDAFTYEEWRGEYVEWISPLVENYHIPYKSLKAGESDLVNAHIVNSRNFNTDSLRFEVVETKKRITHYKRNNEIQTLVLPVANESYTVAAFSGNTEIGRLSVSVYDLKREKVIIVPIVDIPYDRDSGIKSAAVPVSPLINKPFR